MGIRYSKIYTLARLFLVLFFLSIAFGAWADYDAPIGPTKPAGLGSAFSTDDNSPLKVVAEQGAGFNSTATFESIIGLVITTVLSLMGVIFLILAIYGGYNWMMARGNEEMVERAKKTITNAIIGLIVILAAYAISRFIIAVIGAKVF